MKKVFSCIAVFFVLCCLVSPLKEANPAKPKTVNLPTTTNSGRPTEASPAVKQEYRSRKINLKRKTTSNKKKRPESMLEQEARLSKEYDEVIRKLRDSCFFYTLMLLHTEQWKKAEAELLDCMSHRNIGEQPMFLRNLGWAQFRQGRYDEAQRSFRKAITSSYGWDKKTILEWYLTTLERYDPEDELETVQRMLDEIQVKKH